MMKRLGIIFALLLWVLTFAQAQFRTKAIDENVHTLRVIQAGGWDSLPVIKMNSDEQIEISFDAFGAEAEHYTYTITHCNADWKPSQLIESEYMNGFQHLYVDDYAYSFNTKMDYVNYKLYLPNDDIRFKVSGNYVVQVFRPGSDEALLNACFSVIEPGAQIDMSLSSVTDRGANTFFQRVTMEVTYGNEVKSPMQDIKVFVRQNNRFDNEAAMVEPLNVQNKRLVFDHNPALIFEAGNEYHSFEMLTTKTLGLNIESITYQAPCFHSILRPNAIRSDRPYSFYQDINGRVFLRSLDVEDSEVEGDYQMVHFMLPIERPFAENVYILSEAFNNQLDWCSQMDYDEQLRAYVKVVPLKEGYYNYLYVTKPKNRTQGSATLIEGNFYQTENEYTVWVYFRPQGGRYDRLVGLETLQFK